MSPVIDNRVVEMEFDNSRFERNVSTSISTLDKLKAALRLDGASKGLESIENTSRNFNLDGIGSAVDTISSKFSSFGIIGMTVLQDIGHEVFKVSQQLLNMVNSLTVGQIMPGWNKYADKTSAVQTIMAATSATWDEYSKSISYTGSQMDYVNDQMQKLNWFTDETSYNFVDMVSSIGKFTANAIPLDTAVTSMQGIATWTAVSGQNAATASRVMYNMAQAIGAGQVKLQDFMSLENANVATAAFKNKVMEVAEQMNILKRDANGTLYALDESGKQSKKVEVNLANFRTTLSAGWFTKDVLINVLDQYGAFTNELYELSSATDLTATEILSLVEAQEAGTLTTEQLSKVSSETGISVEDLRTKIESLASDENEFGRAAFRAAQEAKTFQEAVDSVKDAASTKWMNIFENLFGDYEKARHLWTGFAEFLYDIFITPLEKIENLSKIVGNIHGIERLGEAFSNVFTYLLGDGEDVLGVLGRLKQGFQKVFPPLNDGDLLMKIGMAIKAVQDWAKQLEVSWEAGNKLETLGQIIGRAFIFVKNSFTNLWDATKPIRTALSNLASAISDVVFAFLRLSMPLEENEEDLDNLGLTGEKFQRVCQVLADIIDNLTKKIQDNKELVSSISDALRGLWNILQYITATVANFWEDMQPLIDACVNLATAIGEVIVEVLGLNSEMDTSGLKIEGFSDVVQTVADFVNTLADAIREANIAELLGEFSSIASIGEKLKSAFGGLSTLASTALGGIISAFQHLKDFLTGTNWNAVFKVGIGAAIAGLAAYKVYIAHWLLTPLKNLSEMIGEFADQLWTMNLERISSTIKNIAIAIGILAVSLLILSYVDYGQAITGLTLIAGVLGGLYLALQNMSTIKTSSITKFAGVSVSLVLIASAMLIFAVSLVVLAGALALFAVVVKMDTIAEGLLYLAATLTVAIVALYALSKIGPKVLIGVVALTVLAGALILLATALAIFTAAAKMDTIAEGLLYLAATLTVAIVALYALSKIGPKVLIGVVALTVFAGALILLATALAIFAATAKMDTIAEGVLYMAATLAVVVVALMALASVGPKAIVAAASILVVSAALLVLAVALTAFSLIAGTEGAWAGLAILITLLAALTIALMALAACGPMVIVAAGSLLLVATACLVLAAALAVVGLALPLLAVGLAALGAAIGSALTSIGQGAQDFLVSLSEALVAIGDALAEIISSIGEALGGAVGSLGEGIGEAITAIISSVGEGIGKGITAISDSIGTFGENLTNAGLGIENLGNSVRSLTGIDWLGTAVGIGELAGALKKLKGSTGAVDGLTEMFTQLNAVVPQLSTIGEGFGDALIAGIALKESSIQAAAAKIGSSASQGLTSSNNWFGIGANYGQGFINGLMSKLAEAYDAGADLANAAEEGAANASEEHSPSKVATRQGEYFGDGWIIGISNRISEAKNTAAEMVNGVISTVDTARNLISGILENDFTPTITPVLDLSQIQKDAALMSALSGGNILNSIDTSGIGLRASLVGSPTSLVGPTYNIIIDGIKYNSDDYVDNSIQNFVETMVRKNKMYTGR